MSPALRGALGGAAVLGALVAAVVFLWPSGPRTGPEPIAWGRDTCAHCRMHLSQPGYAAEMRDRSGTLHKYDDVGCLVAAIVAARAEVPEAWVEDHEGGGFVPLLSAHLVRAAEVSTPMGHGVVAFKEPGAARAFAEAHGGRLVRFEELLHDPLWLARVTGRPGSPPGGSP
jgi:copper chaperone NosL